MISGFLYRNPRLLILILAVIAVMGLSSYYVLPRMEDPVLGKRVALISTVFPGADSARVESQVGLLTGFQQAVAVAADGVIDHDRGHAQERPGRADLRSRAGGEATRGVLGDDAVGVRSPG